MSDFFSEARRASTIMCVCMHELLPKNSRAASARLQEWHAWFIVECLPYKNLHKTQEVGVPSSYFPDVCVHVRIHTHTHTHKHTHHSHTTHTRFPTAFYMCFMLSILNYNWQEGKRAHSSYTVNKTFNF